MFKSKRRDQNAESSSSGSYTKNNEDSEDQSLQVPVFLNRNRRKMKQIRKHLWRPETKEEAGELVVENGLVMRQVPLIRKLFYDPNSSDFMAYKRRRTSTTLTVEQQAAQDYATQLKLEKVLEA